MSGAGASVLLTPEAAAERLGTSRDTIRRAVLAGRLRARSVVGPGDVLVCLAIEEGELERFEMIRSGGKG